MNIGALLISGASGGWIAAESAGAHGDGGLGVAPGGLKATVSVVHKGDEGLTDLHDGAALLVNAQTDAEVYVVAGLHPTGAQNEGREAELLSVTAGQLSGDLRPQDGLLAAAAFERHAKITTLGGHHPLKHRERGAAA
jgi:hypothetical protein